MSNDDYALKFRESRYKTLKEQIRQILLALNSINLSCFISVIISNHTKLFVRTRRSYGSSSFAPECAQYLSVPVERAPLLAVANEVNCEELFASHLLICSCSRSNVICSSIIFITFSISLLKETYFNTPQT